MMAMDNKIQNYFSLVQNYYDNQSKYLDSRIDIHKQTKKLIDLNKQIMSFEQEKELKKSELESLNKKSNPNEKEKEKKTKLNDSIKDLKDKISKKKLEIEKATGERDKINANSRFFKKKTDELLEELNTSKPDPSLSHPLNYLLLK